MKAKPMAKMRPEPLRGNDAWRLFPDRITDRQLQKALCDAGQENYCPECMLCEFGREAIRRGIVREALTKGDKTA